MNINLMHLKDELDAHREILAAAYKEVQIADSPVLTESPHNPGVYEVWWPTNLGTFLHITPEGVRVEQGDIMPDHYIAQEQGS